MLVQGGWIYNFGIPAVHQAVSPPYFPFPRFAITRSAILSYVACGITFFDTS